MVVRLAELGTNTLRANMINAKMNAVIVSAPTSGRMSSPMPMYPTLVRKIPVFSTAWVAFTDSVATSADQPDAEKGHDCEIAWIRNPGSTSISRSNPNSTPMITRKSRAVPPSIAPMSPKNATRR